MPIFPVRCEGDDVLKYIFPSKQRDVQSAIEAARQNTQIKRLIVFGSAVTLNCGMGSDLDIAVDAPSIESEDDFLKLVRPIRRAVQSETDIVHYNCIRSALLKQEIDQKGIEVYIER